MLSEVATLALKLKISQSAFAALKHVQVIQLPFCVRAALGGLCVGCINSYEMVLVAIEADPDPEAADLAG